MKRVGLNAKRIKREIAKAAKASGDDAARREAQSKINALQEKYEKVSRAAGLDMQRDRMRVAGFRRVKTVDQLKGTPKYAIMPLQNASAAAILQYTRIEQTEAPMIAANEKNRRARCIHKRER